MKKLGLVSVFSLPTAFFFMALEHEYRVFAYISLMVFVLSSFLGFFLLKNRFDRVRHTPKVCMILLLIFFLSSVQIFVSYQNNGFISYFDIFRVIYAVFVFWGLVISISIWGAYWFSLRVSIVILFYTALSFLLFYSGFYLDSMNFYASMLVIPTMYFLLIGRVKIFLMLLFGLLFLGVVFEARGAYLVMLLFLFFYGFDKVVKLRPILLISGLLILLLGQYALIDSHTLYADELLSYRPTIWKYYYQESLDSFWFGNGPILEFVSEGAASYYQYMIGRGVGVAYGTQSMYVLYLYESGIIGIVLLMTMFYVSFLTRSKYLIPVFSIAFLAFMETVKVGAVSIYGLPLTYFLALSLVTEGKQNV
ncbi:hypothetical protein [Neptunomonas phycophila]|uniref:hypothetical protein n=1 Tax=Neptunomonas phycophila TaxID=1572645 RepID=UPI000948B34F|nr:hypothetical protein [Neptunomonas phycophila]